MTQLETYEWTRFWCERTEDESAPRALLIGDSITEGYMHEVNRRLDGRMRADSITTSMALDREDFFEGIEWFIKGLKRKYAVVHFNNGLHGFHLSAEAYAQRYEEMVLRLLEAFPEAELVLASSTPVYLPGAERKVDEVKNGQVLERNKAAARIAEKYGLRQDDLYGLCAGKDDRRTDDGFHYSEKGRLEQAEQVARCLEECLAERLRPDRA